MNEQTPPPLHPCPECGGKRISALVLGARVAVLPENPPTVGAELEEGLAKRYPRFLAKLFYSTIHLQQASTLSQPVIPDSYRSSLEAVVCTVCDYTSLFTRQPEKLL